MGSKFGLIIAVAMGVSAVQTLVPQDWPLAPRVAQAQTVDDKVKAIVTKHLGVAAAKVTPGARFKEDLGADDLDIVELVMAFEEEFKVEIPDDAAEKFTRVGDAIRYLRGKVK